MSKFESLLPGNASVRLVKESAAEGLGALEVYLNSLGPAMALRDVARAVEMVGKIAGLPEEDNPFAEVLHASVHREGKAVLP